jgi:hypothetical protein
VFRGPDSVVVAAVVVVEGDGANGDEDADGGACSR